MKLLPMRLYLMLALALIVVVALLSACATNMVLNYSTTQAQQDSTLIRAMLTDTTHWTNPAWQQSMRKKFSSLNMAVVIRNQAGQVIYQSGSYDSAGPVCQEVLVTDGTHQLGIASIYEHTPTVVVTLYVVYLGLLALLLTLASVVWFFTRMVLKPLNAIKLATQAVSCHQLSFQFPRSRVREVAEAFHSFTTMGEALQAALVKQSEIEQERRLLISAVAHDLRTPLFSLRGYLEGLAMGLANTPEKAARYIEVCQTKAATLERLVADLFSYTQLEYLEQMPHQEPLVIDELVDHVLESLQPQAQSRNVTLTVDGPPMPCIVQADAHLLTRVFENLLDNALRYTPLGSSIRIRWYAQHHQLFFTVTDEGPGIASADLPHLFTPLYRGDTSRSNRTGGAGLGLSIAQRILRAHGGDLTAANATTGGAVFTGSLKIVHDQEAHAGMAASGEIYSLA